MKVFECKQCHKVYLTYGRGDGVASVECPHCNAPAWDSHTLICEAEYSDKHEMELVSRNLYAATAFLNVLLRERSRDNTDPKRVIRELAAATNVGEGVCAFTGWTLSDALELMGGIKLPSECQMNLDEYLLMLEGCKGQATYVTIGGTFVDFELDDKQIFRSPRFPLSVFSVQASTPLRDEKPHLVFTSLSSEA